MNTNRSYRATIVLVVFAALLLAFKTSVSVSPTEAYPGPIGFLTCKARPVAGVGSFLVFTVFATLKDGRTASFQNVQYSLISKPLGSNATVGPRGSITNLHGVARGGIYTGSRPGKLRVLAKAATGVACRMVVTVWPARS